MLTLFVITYVLAGLSIVFLAGEGQRISFPKKVFDLLAWPIAMFISLVMWAKEERNQKAFNRVNAMYDRWNDNFEDDPELVERVTDAVSMDTLSGEMELRRHPRPQSPFGE